MRYVTIATGFWTQDTAGWTADARLLYLWSWTNDHAHGLSGIYACGEASILAETGLTKCRLKSAKAIIGDKIRWYPGSWMWVRGRAKHALAGSQEQYVSGVESYLKTVPSEIQADFWQTYAIKTLIGGKKLFTCTVKTCPSHASGIPEPRPESDAVNRIRKEQQQHTSALPSSADKPPTPPPPFGEIQEAWNGMAANHGLPSCTKLSPKRERMIRARWADDHWRGNFKAALERIGQSAFLKGNGSTGWKASFDWIITPDAVLKIMEGKYDGAPGNNGAPRKDFDEMARDAQFKRLGMA